MISKNTFINTIIVINIINSSFTSHNLLLAQKCEPQEVNKLHASDGYPWHMFGSALKIDGNRIIVGTIADKDKGDFAGAAYIYHYKGSEWIEEAKLLATYGHANDWLGASVTIQGNIALVGATGDDDRGTSAGAVYVYKYNGENWTEQVKLTATDGIAYEYFGYSVALDGNFAIIGTNAATHGNGSAYIFQYDGVNTWTQQTKLLASDGQIGDRYGTAVAISNNIAVVGAYTDDSTEINTGSAYVYNYDGSGNWHETTKLTASTPQYNAKFGASVNIYGYRIVIGAPSDVLYGMDTGAVYVFKYNGANWLQEDRLVDMFGWSDDDLGNTVALIDNIIIAGAPGDDDNGIFTGSASMFVYSDSKWYQYAKIYPENNNENQYFGGTISISGNACIIGAAGDDDLGAQAGAVYIFDLNPECNPTLKVSPNPIIAGQDAAFTIRYAKPNTKTYLTYSTKGTGNYYIEFLNVMLNIKQPEQAGEVITTDHNGTAMWNFHIPKNRAGKNIWLQGCQFEIKTNVVATEIQ